MRDSSKKLIFFFSTYNIGIILDSCSRVGVAIFFIIIFRVSDVLRRWRWRRPSHRRSRLRLRWSRRRRRRWWRRRRGRRPRARRRRWLRRLDGQCDRFRVICWEIRPIRTRENLSGIMCWNSLSVVVYSVVFCALLDFGPSRVLGTLLCFYVVLLLLCLGLGRYPVYPRRSKINK